MGAGKIVAVIVILVIVGAGVIFVVNMLPGEVEPDTMTIKFTATDVLAGSTDAATSAVIIYRLMDGKYVQQETVTMTAAQTESTLTYTTGEILWLKAYDASDTSVCTQYLKWTVPQGTPAQMYDGSFQCALHFVDRGNSAYDILIKYHNNTAIASSATLDVTTESWDSTYAEIDFELRNLNTDAGYRNTHNFLKGYDNNHYIVFSASGTGYDSVNFLTTTTPYGPLVGSYERGSVFYWVVALQSEAIDRDQQSGGEFDPDGVLHIPLTLDLTGFASGDSVTFTYTYKYYASWDLFQKTGNWGTDAADNPASAETVTIQY